MAHRRKYFKVKVREPYMGNEVSLKIEVRVVEEEKGTFIDVYVTNPEGMRYIAQPISIEVFNE